MNDRNKMRGFTIVELLIVIVVIGILTTITVVSYASIQNKARTATTLANAQEVQAKADLYASTIGNGAYPANVTTFESTPITARAALSPAIKALLGTTAPSAIAQTALIYQQCTTSGARIGYWDSMARSLVYLYAGTATSATACSAAS